MNITKYDAVILTHYKYDNFKTRKEFLCMDKMNFKTAFLKVLNKELIKDIPNKDGDYQLTFKGMWVLYLYEHNR